MKNITPEWEIVHMERVVADHLKGPNQVPQAVYLLHKGHAVSVTNFTIDRIIREGPPYSMYWCSHCDITIPLNIMERWIKMRKFLG